MKDETIIIKILEKSAAHRMKFIQKLKKIIFF